MLRTVYRLIKKRKFREVIVGLFITFTIVPDFIILDAYGIPGTFVLVFLFMCCIPFLGILKDHTLRMQKGDGLLIVMLTVVLLYALCTKYVFGVTTDYYGTKLFEYIYTMFIPMIVIIHYRETIIKSYDLWKPIFIYAIMAYVFKNFSLVGIRGFRETYLLNYEELKNVIFAARILAVGAIICIYDLLRKYNLKTLMCLTIFLLQILLFESRGPILSVVVSGFIMWWFKSGKDKLKKNMNSEMLIGISIFILLAIFGVRYLWDAGYLERIVLKINMLKAGNRNETRYFLYPTTIQAIKEHLPWGVGFGNSKIGIMSVNSYFKNNYPHNIILEILLEEGLFIAIPMFIIFIKWFGSILMKKRYTYHSLLFFTLYVFSFISAMFSGDLAGNSNVFFFGYLAYCSSRMTKNLKGR